ncbi:hypothetical protein AYO44_06175 [Planctomycetaceae bacterium SCGC AG-212-F19]|nr:hypothetical protein AYO44_06175 [Planctomycetaceae bacterium SCGC AG-212-F19]
MADSQADIFFELTAPGGGKVEGDCTDTRWAGLIEIDDFEMSGRSLASKQQDKESESDDEGDEKGKGGKGKKGKQGKKKKKKSDGQDFFTLKITKDTDRSSPELALSYSRNLASVRECFPKGRLLLRKRGATNFIFLTILFTNLYVVNYKLSMSGGKGTGAHNIPDEDIEFVFESCAFRYSKQAITGGGTKPIIIGWDFQQHERASSLEKEL